MRNVEMKMSDMDAWVLAPGCAPSFSRIEVLVVSEVPDDVSDAEVVKIANRTDITSPAFPKAPPTVKFTRLGHGKFVNLSIGRPPGSGGPRLAPEDATQPRSVRLNDARWEKLQKLGRNWLERAIDRAREPVAPTL